MVSTTDAIRVTAIRTPRGIGVVPSASMIVGAAIAAVWLWLPLTILAVGITSIPSLIGVALSAVVRFWKASAHHLLHTRGDRLRAEHVSRHHRHARASAEHAIAVRRQR
jgi:hypothetical protein